MKNVIENLDGKKYELCPNSISKPKFNISLIESWAGKGSGICQGLDFASKIGEGSLYLNNFKKISLSDRVVQKIGLVLKNISISMQSLLIFKIISTSLKGVREGFVDWNNSDNKNVEKLAHGSFECIKDMTDLSVFFNLSKKSLNFFRRIGTFLAFSLGVYSLRKNLNIIRECSCLKAKNAGVKNLDTYLSERKTHSMIKIGLAVADCVTGLFLGVGFMFPAYAVSTVGLWGLGCVALLLDVGSDFYGETLSFSLKDVS